MLATTMIGPIGFAALRSPVSASALAIEARTPSCTAGSPAGIIYTYVVVTVERVDYYSLSTAYRSPRSWARNVDRIDSYARFATAQATQTRG